MKHDTRWMAACLRLARRHRGLTGTNPSVGTLLVKNGRVVGRGITAKGGRPHAERVALDEAGDAARNATAYVTLEPCAHHGATPPCATALIDAGVGRVVAAWTDPDARVDGKGFAMLRAADVPFDTDVCAAVAGRDLAAYLRRKRDGRVHVTLKLAMSADGFIGRAGEEVAITGALARAYGHGMRAEHDAIAVGRGTVEADDPDLTCRLPGLADRSPHRFVLTAGGQISAEARLVRTAREVATTVVSNGLLANALRTQGVRHMAAETHDGGLALPEVLEDMAGQGLSSLLVEGGAALASAFLASDLVDALALFVSPGSLGGGIASPITPESVSDRFVASRRLQLGPDRLHLFERA